MARIAAVFLCLAGFTLWASPSNAELNIFEGAVMPGEVIKGHAKFEKECKKCHKPFKKSEQNKLCLACHDHANIAKDIASGQGYHGHQRDRRCSDCHTDHKGREMDIAPLNKHTFDHDLTNFRLDGKHAESKVKCESCHKSGTKYRDAPSTCFACHRRDDDHKGQRGKDCSRCHVTQGWNKVRFDHNTTHFPLRGKHRQVKCKSCHVNERRKGLPKNCYACHRRDDPHKGEQGRRCEQCHNESSWHRTSFDHGMAQFPLLGKHVDVDCKKCHKKRTFQDAPVDCVACHEKDDEHKGRLGSFCELCHKPRGWEYWVFDHNKQTDFPLEGKHKRLDCLACHKHKVKKQISLSTDCQSCHRDDDVHDGAFGRFCQRCHVTSSFRGIKILPGTRR